MPLMNPLFAHSAAATFVDARRDLEGFVVRNAAGVMRAGVFPDHLNPLVTGRSDMKVNIADFRAVQNRGGAVPLANVGTDTSVTLPAAPGANKRIDLVYETARSSNAPWSDGAGNDTPIFGFVQGTASATPVAPSLPSNLSTAIPLATVEIPAGATSTLSAGVVITQVYPYTALAGGTVVVRNSVELAAWTPADGARAFCISDNCDYVRSGGQWTRPAGSRIAFAEASTTAPVNALDMPVTTPPLAAGQRVRVKTSPIGGSSAGVTPLPYFLRHTTNGSAVTTTSPELAIGRFLPASGGNVVSAVPLEVEFTMPAAGVLKVALNTAFAVYSDPRWLAIYTAQ